MYTSSYGETLHSISGAAGGCGSPGRAFQCCSAPSGRVQLRTRYPAKVGALLSIVDFTRLTLLLFLPTPYHTLHTLLTSGRLFVGLGYNFCFLTTCLSVLLVPNRNRSESHRNALHRFACGGEPAAPTLSFFFFFLFDKLLLICTCFFRL